MAAVVAFLLSDEASFVTGAVLPVDGGLTAGTPSFGPPGWFRTGSSPGMAVMRPSAEADY